MRNRTILKQHLHCRDNIKGIVEVFSAIWQRLQKIVNVLIYMETFCSGSPESCWTPGACLPKFPLHHSLVQSERNGIIKVKQGKTLGFQLKAFNTSTLTMECATKTNKIMHSSNSHRKR